jgi:hypothetical protein
MRNIIITALGIVALLAMSAFAGDYHTGTTLLCAECHVMHASQTHGYNANGGGSYITPNGTHEYLLRDEVNALCLNCHDGQGWAPDVLAAPTATLPNGRQAGALNRDNAAPYFDATGHTLGSTATAPGGTWSNTAGLECTNCHQQHGRTGPGSANLYRNVNLWVAGSPTTAYMTYAVGATNDLTKDVYERSATSNHYDVSNIDFNEPDQTKSGYGQYCQQCHTNFHGNQASTNMRNTAGTPNAEWYRHPTADANIGQAGGGGSSLSRFRGRLYRVQVMSATGDWGTQGTAWPTSPTDLTASCMSCHKAHGDQNAFGLIYATGNAPIGENGDGTSYKNLCGQCHSTGQ